MVSEGPTRMRIGEKPKITPSRVNRGGSFANDARRLRASYRNNDHPNWSHRNQGFRVAKVPQCQTIIETTKSSMVPYPRHPGFSSRA